MQAETPEQPAARPYAVVVGHLVGLLAGFAAVWLCGAAGLPSALATHTLHLPHVWAAALAITLTLLLGGLLRASHPPAAATTLLAALGGFPATLASAATVLTGVMLVAVLGEGLRRLRLNQQARPP